MDLDALFNNLLYSGTDAADPTTARRVKGLNSLHLIFIMIAPIVGLFYFYIGAIFFFYVFIIAGVFMILSNLAADLVKAKIDKRIFKEIIN